VTVVSDWGEISWDDVVAEIGRQGRDAFVASVTPAGRPHLAIVWLVLVDDVVHLVGDRSSVKMRNLALNPSVACHWQVVNDARDQLYLRGTAALVEDPAERGRLWSSGAWGDLGEWYDSPSDPNLAFVRIDAAHVSITAAAGSGPRRRWRTTTG
jgi:general stress protein 26